MPPKARPAVAKPPALKNVLLVIMIQKLVLKIKETTKLKEKREKNKKTI
jgi:hypothetical protein